MTYDSARTSKKGIIRMRTVFILIGIAVVAFFLVKGIKAYFAERNGNRFR